MTVIAYDGKILAADKQASWCSTKNTDTKILTLKAGDSNVAIGKCGSVPVSESVQHWYEGGMKEGGFPEYDKDNYGYLIVATHGKLVYFYRYPTAIHVEDDYYAFGSGGDAAMGAMYQGANAIEAVRAAMHIDSECGRGIDYIDLETMEFHTLP